MYIVAIVRHGEEDLVLISTTTSGTDQWTIYAANTLPLSNTVMMVCKSSAVVNGSSFVHALGAMGLGSSYTRKYAKRRQKLDCPY